MARRKDSAWSIPDGEVSADLAALAVLMDIRDELKILNRIFNCSDVLGLPQQVGQIVRNTTQRPRKKATK